jgi:hypothetical protein
MQDRLDGTPRSTGKDYSRPIIIVNQSHQMNIAKSNLTTTGE